MCIQATSLNGLSHLNCFDPLKILLAFKCLEIRMGSLSKLDKWDCMKIASLQPIVMKLFTRLWGR